MPQDLMFKGYLLNKKVIDELGIDISAYNSINYKQIVDIYNQAKNKKTVSENFYISSYGGNDMFSYDEYPTYIDEETGIASFDSERFKEYLELTKNVAYPEVFEMPELSVKENELCKLVMPQFISPLTSRDILRDSEDTTRFLPFKASNGDMIAASTVMGITSSSKNKELAWEFIKFCVEEKDYTKITIGVGEGEYPFATYNINRKNNLQLLRNVFGEENKDFVTQVDRWCSELNLLDMHANNLSLQMVINEICEDYYKDLISAEECARRVQERVEIYLKE